MRVPLTRSFGAKIFYLICFCLCAAIVANSLQNGSTFYNYLNQNVESDILQKAQGNAGEARALIDNWLSQMSLAVQNTMSLSRGLYEVAAKNFLIANPNFVGLEIYSSNPASGRFNSEVFVFANRGHQKDWLGQNPEVVGEKITELNRDWILELAKDKSPEVAFRNLQPKLNVALFGIAVPYTVKGSDRMFWGILTVWQRPLLEVMAGNRSAKINLVSKNLAMVVSTGKKGEMERRSPLLKKIQKTDAQVNFVRWRARDGRPLLSAFTKLHPYDLYLIVDSDLSHASWMIKTIIVKTALYSLLFLLLAILLTYFATARIVRNLRLVTEATERISDGDLAARITVDSKDEIGVLGASVNAMAEKILTLLGDRVQKARMEKELETTKLVQKSFFPDSSYRAGPLKVVAKNMPASECSGDWWGHFSTEQGLEYLFIADATGHGAPAALTTAMIYSISTLMAQLMSKKFSSISGLNDIFSEFNQVLWKAGKGKASMTMTGLCLDPSTNTLSLINAGHLFPIFIPQNKDSEQIKSCKAISKVKTKGSSFTLAIRGNPLGVLEQDSWTETQIPLAPGDKIILYTDGIIECANAAGKEWGKRNLLKTIEEHANAEPELLKNVLFGKAFYHFGSKPIDDDITVVVLEMDNKMKVAA